MMPTQAWNVEPYLRYLAAECNRLRLSVIDPQYVTPTRRGQDHARRRSIPIST